MGEAFIVGRASGGSSGGELKTEIFTSNTLWIAPKAVNQSFSVRIFGGGAYGAGGSNGGDGSFSGGGGYSSAAPAGNGGNGICIIQYYV